MMVDHPGYKTERVLLFPDVVQLTTDLSAPPPNDLGFSIDWPAPKLLAVAARLPALRAASAVVRSDIVGTVDADSVCATGTTTFQDLLANAGVCKNLALDEGAETDV